MYTDKKKIFYAIFLFIISLFCLINIIRGAEGSYLYIGLVLGVLLGISFLRNARS